jgi:hypothetical protein
MATCRATDRFERCKGSILYDGLWCESHYRRFKRLVLAGETTWERLAKGQRRVSRTKPLRYPAKAKNVGIYIGSERANQSCLPSAPPSRALNGSSVTQPATASFPRASPLSYAVAVRRCRQRCRQRKRRPRRRLVCPPI